MIICNRGNSFIRVCISKMRHRILPIPRKKEDIVDVIDARNMTSTCDTSDNMVVPKEEVVRFIAECLCQVGTLKEDAYAVGCHLMTSDYRGHFSHGMNRLQMYVNDIQKKLIDPLAKPNTVQDFKAIALVDGQNGLGQIVGNYCMKLAIKKAKEYGIGMVSARGSNHFGICSYYTLMAMKENLIGFNCTNTSPLMAPTRAKKAALGTNPISLGMLAENGDEFLLDIATTAVALGKIELAMRKNESIPSGWALDSEGKVTTNATDAFNATLLMPLGGEEKFSGYKGYGLATMVEILCGILSGSHFGPNIRAWKKSATIADLGHCFMAIDPEAFSCGSKERLSLLLCQLRELPKSGKLPVLVAGDYEKSAMAKVDKEGGIMYHPNQIKDSAKFAELMKVSPMKLIPKMSS
ncbi:putative oxidoreductase YjmC-like [Vespula squamosa]|uniref:Oxidoreductase YjmC-like n=1 Tax=Vespula squamosa TaxID=30214 RepID=A0ABD2C6H8_VESSQ